MLLIREDMWYIEKTAEKGFGIFAKTIIAAGVVIGDYLGTMIRTADYDVENDRSGLYLTYYSDQASIYPDRSVPGVHLLNHSCDPNCWMYIFRGHTLFFSLREIRPGEELTISYLLSPLDDACSPCPHICRCLSHLCTGTMHLTPEKYTTWQAYLRSQQHTRRASFTYGEMLPKLASYPAHIPDHPIYTYMRT